MSRFNRLWVLVPMVLIASGLGVTPASATTDWSSLTPTPSDVCGVSQDRFHIPAGDPLDDVSWKDSRGALYSAGTWNSTNGAASVTLTAKKYNLDGPAEEHTFPAMTFGVEPDSSCVEAADTVATAVVACNTVTNGTRVTFTYTNTDDATDRAHTYPRIMATRWDNKQSAYVVPTFGQVADGQQASITGGDSAEGGSDPSDFFLAPGTYSLALTTNETSGRVLPNRLFVPACGDYTVPPGDPHGGPIVTPPPVSRPKAVINRCRYHRVKVVLDGRQATRAVRYRVVIDPRRGPTRVRYFTVAAKQYKTPVFYRQRAGTVVKVTFVGKVVQRKLYRC